MYGKGGQISTGRKPGSINRANKVVKSAIAEIVADNVQQIRIDLMELDPKDRVNALIQLSKFVIPTMKAVEVEGSLNDHSSTIIDAIMNSDENTIKDHINANTDD